MVIGVGQDKTAVAARSFVISGEELFRKNGMRPPRNVISARWV
jgi:hypothetical protein